MLQVFRPSYDVDGCLREIKEVLDSGWTGTGPKCKRLEKEWSQFIGCSHSLFLNSATSGLHLALRVCDLKPGTKVITTPTTFASTNAVILYEGLEPVFVDVDPQTLSLDANRVREVVEQEDIGAIIWVHYSGNPTEEFECLAEELKGKVKIIEDCAHSAGAFYSTGKRVGSNPDTISVFSYQAVKNMPTFDSGMLCLGDEKLIERAKKLSWLGIDKSTFERSEENEYRWKYTIDELGWKYNGNDVAAAVALVQLKRLDRDNAYRRQLYRWYCDVFYKDFEHEAFKRSRVRVLPHSEGSSVHFCAIEVDNRDAVMNALRLKGIAPGMHYLPNHLFPAFRKFYRDCPVAERMADRLLTLPTHLLVTKQDVERIGEVVLSSI